MNNGMVVPMPEHNGHPTGGGPRLRLVKVVVQPVFVLVDDDEVSEVQSNVVEVKASQWHEWAASAFTPEAIAAMQASLQPVHQEPTSKETSQ